MIPEITAALIHALLDGLPLAALVLMAAVLIHLAGLLLGVRTTPREVISNIWDARRRLVRRFVSRVARRGAVSGRRSRM